MQTAIQYIKNQLNQIYPETEIKSLTRIILSYVCNLQFHEIITRKDSKIPPKEYALIEKIVSELQHHKPIQYIIGETEFYGLPFQVNPNVLIPRPETEELVDLIIHHHKNESVKIIDIGTGSGCIAISLARFLSNADVSAIDISEEALNTAKRNAEINQVRVNFLQLDILSDFPEEDLSGSLDLIVSNPPYVTQEEKKQMEANVLEYEPHLALFVPEKQPLLFYNHIADFGLKKLKKGGHLYFEINSTLGKETSRLISEKGYSQVTLIKDISSKDRIIHAIL